MIEFESKEVETDNTTSIDNINTSGIEQNNIGKFYFLN